MKAYKIYLPIKISQRNLLFSGSKPVVGSSNSIIRGFPTKAIATESLLLIPPNNKYYSVNRTHQKADL